MRVYEKSLVVWILKILHKSEKELLKYLSEYQFVYLVYAKSPINLSLDGLQMLSDFVSKKKLVLIKMPKIGPDAADFGLAFLAGQLSIQMDKSNVEFDVMSNDKKIEYIVDRSYALAQFKKVLKYFIKYTVIRRSLNMLLQQGTLPIYGLSHDRTELCLAAHNLPD